MARAAKSDLAGDLAEAARLLDGWLRASAAAAGHSPSEAALLACLAGQENGEALASELARALGMDKAMVTRLSGRLLEEGLLARSQSKQDGRRQPLRLTAKGRKAAEKVSKAREAALSAAGPGARKQLPAATAALLEALRALG